MQNEVRGLTALFVIALVFLAALHGCGDDQERSISQPQDSPRLCLSDSCWSVPVTGGTHPLCIENCGSDDALVYTIKTAVDWLTPSKAVGNTPDTCSLMADENKTGSARSTVVMVTAADDSARVEISQPSADALLCLASSSWSGPPAGGCHKCAVSNCGNNISIVFTAAVDADWLSVVPDSGHTPDTLSLTALPNATGASRSGHLTVSAGSQTAVLDVVQSSTTAALCVDPPQWSATPSGGNQEFGVTNCGNDVMLMFSVSETAPWLYVSSNAGTTPGAFTATADPNASGADRTTQITIGVTGMPPKIITVTQPSTAPMLCASPQEMTASPGTCSLTFSVLNCGNTQVLSFSVDTAADWVTLSAAAGQTPDTLIASCDANVTGLPRSTSLTITSPGLSPVTLPITQPSEGPRMCLTPSTSDWPAAGGNVALHIDNCGNASNVTYSLSESSSWLSIVPSSGTTPGQSTISLQPNRTGTERSGVITVVAVGAAPENLTITQPSLDARLEVSPGSWSAPPAGAHQDISITNSGNDASIAFTVTESSDWISVTPAIDSTPATVRVTTSENRTAGSRTAQIIVSATSGGVSGSPRSVTVSQSRYPAPNACFSLSPDRTNKGVTVTFTNCSSGEIDQYEWSFGDASQPSHLKNPTHVYQRLGTFQVKLTVTGPGGVDIEQRSVSIVPRKEQRTVSVAGWSGYYWFEDYRVQGNCDLNGGPQTTAWFTLTPVLEGNGVSFDLKCRVRLEQMDGDRSTADRTVTRTGIASWSTSGWRYLRTVSPTTCSDTHTPPDGFHSRFALDCLVGAADILGDTNGDDICNDTQDDSNFRFIGKTITIEVEEVD